jgi:peptidyl-lysine (3S)-dioxygenase / protease
VRKEDRSLEIKEEEGDPVPFPTWDSEEGDGYETQYSQHAKQVRVTLRKGDMLYLPALWHD